MSFLKRSSLLLAALLPLAGIPVGRALAERGPIGGPRRPVATTTTTTRVASREPVPVTGPQGLDVRLYDATAAPEHAEATKPAEAAPLSDAEAEALLARLPALVEEEGDRRDAAMRPPTMPAPRAGVTRLEPWPPRPSKEEPPEIAKQPLEILRHAPEGDVPLAARVAITFSQPMIAVTSHAQAEATIPATITPQPPGAWRWAGTQLLIFEGPDAFRLPMATRYHVSIPAGTKSATGNSLAKAHEFEFTTPPPKVESWTPLGGPQPLDPLIVLLFDQRIDPKAMLAHFRLDASGTAIPVELVDAKNADDASRIRAIAGGDALLDRVLAVRAKQALPYDSTLEMIVEAGAPSAEGPLTTTADQSASFRTLGPMKLVEHRCGWESGTTCRPESPWMLRFSNPIDPERFDPAQVTVSPEVEDLQVNPGDDTIWIQGAFEARSTYEVRVSPRLRDTFGQELEKEERVSFSTGPATAQLTWTSGPLVVVDPGAAPELRVHSAGLRSLKVEAWEVDPGRDWPAYHAALQERWNRPDHHVRPPGRKAFEKAIPVEDDVDALTMTRIDLSPALHDGLGHVIVVVDPGETRDELRNVELVTWAESTKLGLSAFVEPEKLVAWVNELADGAPAKGVELSLGPDVSTATSDRDGLATLSLDTVETPAGLPGQPPGSLTPEQERLRAGNRWLIARRGQDRAFLPENPGGWWNGTSWSRRTLGDWTAWHVFDDRGLYRPGETARIKGIVRTIQGGKTSDVALVAPATSLAWTLTDSQGNEVTKGTASLTRLGGFDFAIELPPNMNLGSSNLRIQGAGSETWHPLRVEEFRRPEYEVKVAAGEGPFLVGGNARVTVTAGYYAGGPLPNAPVHWNVTASTASFHPPGWDEWTFGEFVPWWRGWNPPGPQKTWAHEGTTDASGKHVLGLDFLSCLPPRATSVTCEATVQDVNRQAWTDSTTILVHPSDAWLGLKPRKPFIERGDSYDVEVVVTDRDGKVLEGREVTLRAARTTGRWFGGAWHEEEADAVEAHLTSAASPGLASLKLDASGSWRITGTVRDDEGRPNETVVLAWVSGNEVIESRNLQQQQVELIPDEKEYRPGDVAHVLVRSPIVPAEALVTLRRAGLVKEERLTLKDSGTVIDVPIDEQWIPGITLQVDVNGEQGTPPIPAYATGSVNLAVTRRVRELNVEVKADEAMLEPAGATHLRLKVTDQNGSPAPGEVTVVVADEAVLALTGYQLDDPLLAFYPERGPDVQDHHLRSMVELGDRPVAVTGMLEDGVANPKEGRAAGGALRQEALAAVAPAAAPMPSSRMAFKLERSFDLAAKKDGQPPGSPIALRKNLDALALFAPSVEVGSDGRATVDLKLPDSLTRYRVMAVAVSGPKLFGRGESSVTARKPLMVRPSLPRFLNFGDVAELPVVVQNQTDRAMDVKVAMRATNATLTGAKGFRLRVPPNDRAEIRFPARTDMAGTARVQAVAASGDSSDAAELSLPVWTPATTEAFATYGTIDEGAIAQPVAPPENVLPQFGELSLTTSSTALFELGDATLALWRYPYECSEQISSRLIGVLAVRDALDAFTKLPPRKEVEAAVERDVELLAMRQDGNGDVGLWRHPDAERARWPWVSVHASHAFLLAKAKGYRVDDGVLDRARTMLRDVDARIPPDYPDSCRRAVIAYALFVRESFGDADPRRAKKLLDETSLEEQGLETLGLILPTLAGSPSTKADADRIVTHLRNRAAEESGTITFTQSYGDADWLVMHSSRRTDAVLLCALVKTDPKSDILPKLVRGLLDHRNAGAWDTTQENAFVLLGMGAYFAANEAKAPDFHATAWLGADTLASQEWRGRSTERRVVEVPMRDVLSGGARDVVLSKEGTGRLYWRLGMTYAPSSLKLDPSQHGFVVERQYEAVEDPGDVRRDDDGTWHLKAGARVRSRVTMVAQARRTHVALVDPLPAGVEALNPALETTASVASTGGLQPAKGVTAESRPSWSWWWGPWFEHQNLRDERAEAFTSYLEAGAWEYSWIGRATTPGRFVVPPSKAEEMYHPETFGRSSTDVVVVE